MKRRVLNLVTALSLAFCVASALLWLRSHVATDTLRVDGPRVVRVVSTRGAAVVGVRRGEAGSWEGEIAFGTRDGPRDPDYSPTWLDHFDSAMPDPAPPGAEWTAHPYESFRTIHWPLVVVAFAALPAGRLIPLGRTQRTAARRRSATTARASLGRRILRGATAVSAFGFALSLTGWTDSATWHWQCLNWEGESMAQLISDWGRCEIKLVVDWPGARDPQYAAGAPGREVPPTLGWRRQWLEPAHRAHQSTAPEHLQLFPWFKAYLHDESALATPGRSPATGFTVGVPYWFAALVAALLPGRALARALRSRRRRRAGRCVGCGYNLAGNTSGVCPECGAERNDHAVPVGV